MVDPALLGIPWKKQLWHKWKALRKVPFRRSWFVGYDLEGNSYWELVDHNNPSRLRRKVSLDRPYFHFSDFKPHPMWMQWLQFTRPAPPSLVDLENDAKRQYRLKLLARQADAKWKSVPLKSGQTEASGDPRIDTSWQGSMPAGQRHSPEADPVSASADQKADVNSSADTNAGQQPNLEAKEWQVRKAMEDMANRQRHGPKVYRDSLGQLKVERTKDSGTKAEKKSGKEQNKEEKTKTEKADEPQAASFQPKAR